MVLDGAAYEVYQSSKEELFTNTQVVLEHKKIENAAQLILWGQNNPASKTR